VRGAEMVCGSEQFEVVTLCAGLQMQMGLGLVGCLVSPHLRVRTAHPYNGIEKPSINTVHISFTDIVISPSVCLVGGTQL
jgi:hypothetical protein